MFSNPTEFVVNRQHPRRPEWCVVLVLVHGTIPKYRAGLQILVCSTCLALLALGTLSHVDLIPPGPEPSKLILSISAAGRARLAP